MNWTVPSETLWEITNTTNTTDSLRISDYFPKVEVRRGGISYTEWATTTLPHDGPRWLVCAEGE